MDEVTLIGTPIRQATSSIRKACRLCEQAIGSMRSLQALPVPLRPSAGTSKLAMQQVNACDAAKD